MSQTVAYVRVSTDDQVEYSPDAQEKRCGELARLRGLNVTRVFTDEGWSGKNLDRPAVRELLALVATGDVDHVVVWRWDRLSRDQGDFAQLVKLFTDHNVKVVSVNEGELDLNSASGRMQVGVHGVFAQYYRDQLVENVKMGQRQAVECGRWINQAPTGYQMINKFLEPDGNGPLVVSVFELRAAGLGYQRIADEVGWKYGTVQHICQNRVYLGETQLKGEWFPGLHQPLVTEEQFNAAQRGHTKGQRRSRELLSGKVRCGLCGRVAGVAYNERGQVLYRCRNRGQGCKQPARSANGLHRAARLGLSLLGSDSDLMAAIASELSREAPDQVAKDRSLAASISALKVRQKKLLDLYYADQIEGGQFATENRDLARQVATMENERGDATRARDARTGAAAAFHRVTELLQSVDFGVLWDRATPAEKQTLVSDLIDSICFYPDQLTVQVVGAPPIKVELREVGLVVGIKPIVSEGRREPALIAHRDCLG